MYSKLPYIIMQFLILVHAQISPSSWSSDTTISKRNSSKQWKRKLYVGQVDDSQLLTS